MIAKLTDRNWAIRLSIYRRIVAEGRPPTVAETAETFGITEDEARRAYHRLQRPHQIVLEPGTDTVRMAIPLSAVPTRHRVWIDGAYLFANCAWDSLGVAAMLHQDALIEARSNDVDEPIRYAVQDGTLVAPDGLFVHFPLPLSRWFDDIIST